ncbi:50S ribosomal protein L10 [Candidatus Uhrbacteria bacterium]|nr:50S ribosomal protein L10 [Candidatus Uhrbacteria bacterium]
MSKTRAQKNETIEQLTKAFKAGKSAMFTDYQGMTVQKLSALRKQMHASNVEYIVAKKTLLNIAAKQAGFDLNFKSLPGMLGAAFAMEDEMAPAKLIGDAGKDAPIKLIGGLFEGKFVDQAFVIALSKLPSRDQLIGQLLSVFNGPTAAFVRALNAHQEKMTVSS